MIALLLTFAGMATGVAIREILLSMRNRRGLYGWPRPVQALICIADGIPLSSVGQYPDQQTATDHMWASAQDSGLNEYGKQRRAEARERLDL
jgi:hypothetical protein